MNALKHRLTLEMTVLYSQATIHIKKGDTKNKLIISLSENGKPYEITNNVYAAFVGNKPDGRIVFNECDIVGNTIEYTITAQTSAAVGMVACELRLYDNNGELLTSPRFTVVVDETVYDEDRVETESANEINVLDSLIVEANALLEANKRGEFNGATYTPSINDVGVLGWSNDKGLDNPSSYNLYWHIINNAGWGRQLDGTPNLIGVVNDNRWYKIEEYVNNLEIMVVAITSEGKEKVYVITPNRDSGWIAGNRIAFRFRECTINNDKDIIVKIDVYQDVGFIYGYRTQELTISTDNALEKIDGVYFVSQMLWRNGAADGKKGAQGEQGIAGADGVTFIPNINSEGVLSWSNDGGLENPQSYKIQVDLSEYLTKLIFEEYIKGALTMPSPIVDQLAVLGKADFEGEMTIKEPVNANNPATKDYVNQFVLNYLTGNSTIPLALVQTLSVFGSATFEGEVNVPPPVTDHNPTTKKYIDDLLANIKLAEEGAY